MAATICEKILARAAERPVVQPGQYLWATADATGVVGGNVFQRLRRLGIEQLFDASRVYVTEDHAAPAPSVAAAELSADMRRFVRQYGIHHFYEWGRHGISHELFPAHGFVCPGDFIASIDSHSTSYGAFNAAACSVNEELCYLLLTGKTWLRVPPTVRVELTGVLPGPAQFVVGRDVMLRLASTESRSVALYKCLEFGGPGLTSLSMAGRSTIAVMSAELGAKFAIFPCDEITRQHLEGKLSRPPRPVTADAGAHYETCLEVDLSTAVPYVALPDDPAKGVEVAELVDEKIPIQQAFIGSCANGRLEDFRMAASLLKGRKVHPSVRLVCTPASQAIWQQCLREGIWATLAEAEALVTHSTCGACAGIHLGLLAGEEVCISTGTRNFQGRMGSPQSSIYLANPATVAASAVRGYIADPREFL